MKNIFKSILIFIVCVFLVACGKKDVTINIKGAKLSPLKIKEGEKIKLETPKKEGYKFLGWYYGDKLFDFSKPIDKNITLEAKWEIQLTDEIFTITFDSDGGNLIESQEVNGNGLIVEPNIPTKDGYTFDGWYLEEEKFNFAENRVKENMVLKAVWKDNEKITVMFDSDGGSLIDSQIFNSGLSAIMPGIPIKNGYTFVSWQLDGVNYDFSSKVTSNITLKALWQKDIYYTVSFDSDGGSLINSLSVKSNNNVSRPNNPVKNGYTFVTWQLNGVNYDFSSKVTSNITLKAVWQQNIPSLTNELATTLFQNYQKSVLKDDAIICDVKITHKGINNSYLVTYNINRGSDKFNGGAVLVLYSNGNWNFSLPGSSGFIADGGPDDIFATYKLQPIK